MPDFDGAFGNDDYHFERDESREALREAREAWDEDQDEYYLQRCEDDYRERTDDHGDH